MPKGKSSGYQSKMNSMDMHRADLAQPSSSYAQSHDNATLDVVNRTDRICSKEASQLRSQEFKGKYQ